MGIRKNFFTVRVVRQKLKCPRKGDTLEYLWKYLRVAGALSNLV